MKEKVGISVILAVYNGSRYLRECLDSILCQSFTDFELLVINDGSTDSTLDILKSYDDPRIRLIDNPLNKGLVYSLNLGLSLAEGKYIARIDADDIALSERLQVQFDYLESHPEIGICGSWVEAFYEGTGKRQVVTFPSDDTSIRAFCFFQSPFCHPTVMFRKSVLSSIGLQYPDKYYRAEDYALWIELLNFTQGANLPKVLMRYRKHSNSETVLADKQMEKKRQTVSDVQQQHLSRNGIYLSPEELKVYTSFTDRSIPCNLNKQNQQVIDSVIKSFLFQLPNYQGDLRGKVIHCISQNSFYAFFTSRSIPSTLLLRKLCFKGGFIYLKRLIGLKSF